MRIPVGREPVPVEYLRRLETFDRLADQLDSRFRIPWTSVRFGWDPVIGVVPIAGEIVTTVIALRLVAHGYQLGASRRQVVMMVVNVAIDSLLGAIPFAGWIFDLFFRANLRNLKLLTEEIARKRELDGRRNGPD